MIAEVQGAVVSGGLMLVWLCDLIVCAEDARFRASTAADLAVPGVELFQHGYEMSVRQAKEWLFTGDWLDAATALRRGMVNHVVPRGALQQATLDLAQRVAKTDRLTLKLVKEAMNATQDALGRQQAVRHGFALHQVGHLHNMLAHGCPVDTSRLSPSLQDKMPRRFVRHMGPSRGQGAGRPRRLGLASISPEIRAVAVRAAMNARCARILAPNAGGGVCRPRSRVVSRRFPKCRCSVASDPV